MASSLLSIVIPAYNEESTLEKIVSKTLSVEFPFGFSSELIIVDDASCDKTRQIAKRLSDKYDNVTYLCNRQNLGKSRTVKKGLQSTRGSVVVVQDADLEYDPRELNKMLNLFIRNNLDIVYGNRFGKKNKVIYWQNYLGNRFLSFVSNVFTYPRLRRWIPDMEVCYKMVGGDVMRHIAKDLRSTSSFGLEPEITAKLSRYKKAGGRLKLGVVPISYKARTIEEGKKISATKDGVKAFKEIVLFNIF